MIFILPWRLRAQPCPLNPTLTLAIALNAQGDCLPCFYSVLSCDYSAPTITLDSCQPYYGTKPQAQGASCVPCPSDCQQCLQGSCLQNSCDAGYYYLNGQCSKCSPGAAVCNSYMILQCMDGLFLQGGGCSSCLLYCSLCFNPFVCNSCFPGYYYQSPSCLACTTNCIACTASSCLACSNSLVVSNGCQPCLNGAIPTASDCVANNIQGCLLCREVSAGTCFKCGRCMTTFYLEEGSCVKGGSLLCLYSNSPYYQDCSECSAYANKVPVGNSHMCIPKTTSIGVKTTFLSSYYSTFYSTADYLTPAAKQGTQLAGVNFQTAFQTIYFLVEDTPCYKFVGSISLLLPVGTSPAYELQTSPNIRVTGGFDPTSKFNIVGFVSVGTPKDFKFWVKVAGASIGVSELAVRFNLCSSSNCVRCNTATYCTECKPTFYLQQGQCVQSCSPQFLIDQTNLLCLKACLPEYYVNLKDYLCLPCQPPCLLCSSPTDCQNCRPSFFLTGSQCLSSCLSGQYGDSSLRACLGCRAPCKTCQSGSQCLSCSIGFYSQVGLTCYSICPNSYFGDFTTRLCLRCSQSCNSCLFSASTCTSCPAQTYLLLDRCATACPSGYFTSASQCLACNYPCASCSGSSLSACLTCTVGFFFAGKCYSSILGLCNDGTYYSSGTCTNCPLVCSTCSAQECLSCEEDYFLYSGECLTSCPVGAPDAGRCTVCTQPCLTCTTSVTACSSCIFGLLDAPSCVLDCPNGKYSDGLNCKRCPSSCKLCKSALACQACVASTSLYSGQCLPTCPPSFYSQLVKALSQLQCRSCPNSCTTCSTALLCQSCATGYLLVPNSVCSQSCGSSQFKDEYQCRDCPENCFSCLSQSECTKCKGSLVLSAGNCQTSCPQGTFPQSSTAICTSCLPPCHACASDSYCLSCLGPPFDKYVSGICFSQCPSRYYLQQSQCQPCSAGCLLCSSALTCNACLPSLFKHQGCCVRQCPPTFYKDSLALACSACSQGCQVCSDYFTCSVCTQGLLLSLGQCVLSCNPSYFKDSLRCSKCNLVCLTCANRADYCLSCANNKFLLSSGAVQCLDSCPESYFAGGSFICQPCPQVCRACSSPSFCTRCSQGRYLLNYFCFNSCPDTYYKSNDLCMSCLPPCFTCISVSQCLSCTLGYRLTTSCVLSCPTGFYPSLDSYLLNACLPCARECKACSDESTCTACPSGREGGLLEQGRCVRTCSLGFFQRLGMCLACAPDCRECSAFDQCSTCVKTLIYRGQCLAACPLGTYPQFASLQCLPCKQFCLSCRSSYVCTKCQSGTFLYDQSTCVRAPCPHSYYADHSLSVCRADCLPSQFKVAVQRICVFACKQLGMLQFQSSCISNCAPGYFASQGWKCELCASSCSSLPYFQAKAVASNPPSILVTFSKAISISPDASLFVLKQNTRRELAEVLQRSPWYVIISAPDLVPFKHVQVRVAEPYQHMFDSSSIPLQNIGTTLLPVSQPSRGKNEHWAAGVAVGSFSLLLAVLGLALQHGSYALFLEACQMSAFFPYLGLRLQPDLHSFFQGMSVSHFSFLPNMFKQMKTLSLRTTPSSVYSATGGVDFLHNVGSALIPLLLAGLLSLALLGLRHYARSHSPNLLQLLARFSFTRILLHLNWVFSLPILVWVCLNLSFSSDSLTAPGGFAVAIIFVFLLIALMLGVGNVVRLAMQGDLALDQVNPFYYMISLQRAKVRPSQIKVAIPAKRFNELRDGPTQNIVVVDNDSEDVKQQESQPQSAADQHKKPNFFNAEAQTKDTAPYSIYFPPLTLVARRVGLGLAMGVSPQSPGLSLGLAALLSCCYAITLLVHSEYCRPRLLVIHLLSQTTFLVFLVGFFFGHDSLLGLTLCYLYFGVTVLLQSWAAAEEAFRFCRPKEERVVVQELEAQLQQFRRELADQREGEEESSLQEEEPDSMGQIILNPAMLEEQIEVEEQGDPKYLVRCYKLTKSDIRNRQRSSSLTLRPD